MLVTLKGGETMNIAAVTAQNNIVMGSTNQPMNKQAFGQVFGQLISSPLVQTELNEQPSVTDELLSLLNLSSLEELEELVNENPVTVDKLQELFSDLVETDSSDVEAIEDIWDVLAGILVQSNKLQESIVAAVQPGQIKKEQAIQMVELLKTIQLTGKNSDLTMKQESSLFDLTQLLESIKEEITSNVKAEVPSSLQAIKALQSQKHLLKIISQPITTDPVVEVKEIISTQGQVSSLTQTKVDTVTITLPTEKSSQSEEFVKELQKLMNRVQLGQTGGTNRLVVKLYPEQLGTVRIELIQKDGVLTAKMLASTALGKELLDTHSSQLRNGLAGQNIQLEKLEVSMALQDTSRQERQQSFDGAFKQQHQHQQEEEQNSQEDVPVSFQDLLNGIEV